MSNQPRDELGRWTEGGGVQSFSNLNYEARFKSLKQQPLDIEAVIGKTQDPIRKGNLHKEAAQGRVPG